MPDLNGHDYRATVRLSDPSDVTLALPGETCDRVPAISLPWLLAQGLIVAAVPLSTDEPSAGGFLVEP